ncbi:putative membrane metallo-endo-peptidase [Streptococcus pneumoniae]|nr:putative membrane metallo-endo-peptidase [Streptococcus pneumoniae]VMK17391.1 putative membrane metallo-endo-peptidase [Streptococcus pneumoniae]
MGVNTVKNPGYLALYWDKAEDIGDTSKQKVLHEPTVSRREYRLSSGSIKQIVNGINECRLVIGMNHNLYKKIKPIKGIVKIVNLFDGEAEFYGRVLSVSMSMASDGFAQEIICEDMLAYLHDSCQDFEKVPNRGLEDYLTRIINRHNSQVEPHKRFKIGVVNVPAPSDTPFRYTGYDTSWDTIKDKLIGKTNGYLVLRHETDGMYIDYLKQIGDKINGSPIMLGANIKTATRDLSFDGLLTRIVPVGADLNNGTTSETSSADIIREQVTIKSVNGGKYWLENEELIKQFGLITKSVTWSDIYSPDILKKRGQQYIDNLKSILASWKVDVVERCLIDANYVKFKVGNTHQIINAPMSSIEELQIIEKTINITKPQSVSLTVGSSNQSLSMFQLQQQEAQKSMEKVAADNATKQRQLNEQTTKANNISLLESELSQYQVQLESIDQEIATLNSEIKKMDADSTTTLTTQVKVAQSKKELYESKIYEIQTKLKKLKEVLNE